MSWTLGLTRSDSEPGQLVATVDDETAAQLRDAILRIITRPAFERAGQDGGQPAVTIEPSDGEDPYAWGNPHSAMQRRVRRFLKDQMCRDKAGALGVEELTRLFNATTGQQISESAMRIQLRYLSLVEHRVQRARGAGKVTDPKSFGYWWPEAPAKARPELVVEAGEGVRP
jgi:hypothetical protein